MDKSYVTMEQKVCVVCGHIYNTNSILLDRSLRNRFDHHTVTGWGMCDGHKKLKDAGYVALVACDETKMQVNNGRVQPEDAYRTGPIAHVRASVFPQIFNVEAPSHGVLFCDGEVIAVLQRKMGSSNQVDSVALVGFNALKKGQ